MAPWLSDDFFLLSMSGVAIISAGRGGFGALRGISGVRRRGIVWKGWEEKVFKG